MYLKIKEDLRHLSFSIGFIKGLLHEHYNQFALFQDLNIAGSKSLMPSYAWSTNQFLEYLNLKSLFKILIKIFK